MHFKESKARIEQMAIAASDASRQRFARDTIRILDQVTASVIGSELNDRERKLMQDLLAGITTRPAEELADLLHELNGSMCQDPVRAIEFYPDITELLCAVDNWLDYRRRGDPLSIAGIAMSMVNSLDYAIGGDNDSYSVHNMLGDPRMVAEFERVQRFLSPT